jgi:4-hydroxy-3-polyprenylbenzoate decarboxylase
MTGRRFVVALTGASGAVYGRRLLECLARSGHAVHFLVSGAAATVARHELGIELNLADGPGVIRALLGDEPPEVRYHAVGDLEAPVASGSFRHDGMAVCPCSAGSLGRIAGGISSNLIERAADVCLKERRRLVLVPRETPLSDIHLENMLRLSRAGAVILPASPGFYGPAAKVADLVDFVVSRVLDHLGVENDLVPRYASSRHPEER